MTSTGRILVVDDSDPGRYVKAHVLRSAGYDVDEVNTGQGALDRCASEPYALVLLDVRLPDINGVEVCRRLKATQPTIFVLQTSATFTDTLDRVRSLDSGADAYLVEPMEAAELLAIARSLLRLQRAETALRDSEARLQLAQDVAGLAVIDWDIAQAVVVCSDNFGEIFGFDQAVAPVKSMRDILACVHPEDRAAIERRFADLRAAGGPFELEFRIIAAADGRVAWIASRGQFLQEHGLTVRMLCVNYDVTRRRQAEQMNGQLAAIVASSPDAIVSLDGQDRVLTWNAGAEKLFGHLAADAIGKIASTLIPRERVEERAQAMAQLQAGTDIEYETIRHGPDGSDVDVWVRGAPTRRADGRIDGASLIIRDMSAQKRREDHVRFLLRELTHRSKNLLAVIQAMARQSLNRLGSPEDFVTRFSERLSGLAGSHDLLSSDNFQGASLVQLIRSQLRHYGELVGERILLQGDDLFVKPEAAQNVGIALHELSTNAAKYGALSTPEGVVTIGWAVEPSETGERFRMQWQEAGGPPVVPPTRKGFGHVVMERITGQALSGRSQAVFAPDGVSWTLDAPAANVLSTRVDP